MKSDQTIQEVRQNQGRKPVAIVLGGTVPHVALINELKHKGYQTVLVDYLSSSPGKDAADVHVQESTLDQQKVLDIAIKMQAKLVISACIDQANITACYVSERLCLPKPYSYKTALTISNKVMMKRTMTEAGIPTSKFVIFEKDDEINSIPLDYPIVVKPSDCTGSKAVNRVSDPALLANFITMARDASRTKQALAEEFVSGEEVQIDYFVKSRKAFRILERKKIKIPGNIEGVQQVLGSEIPAGLSDKALEILDNSAQKTADAFDLENTPLFLQAIVNEDTVNVIEFAPRIGGGLSFRLVHLATQFDFLKASVNSLLSESMKIEIARSRKFISTTIIYAIGGTFGATTGVEDLKRNGVIREYHAFKLAGASVGSELSSNNRIGAFICEAGTPQELQQMINEAVGNIDILDENGNSILRTSLRYDKQWGLSKL